jgi:uncharacterized lipoprotein YddW (UPF0748 family)
LNRKLLFSIVAVQLLLGTAMFASVQVLTVKALVPSIVSVSYHDVGSTWLDIVVSHLPPPAIDASHYVSVVQLTINGTTVDLSQETQSTETFTVQYNLGPNTNSYTVSARALCIVHGYSASSDPIIVSESITGILFIVLATVMVVAARKTLGRRSGTSALQ